MLKLIEKDSKEDNTINAEWENKIVEFSKEYMALDEYYLEAPGYQIKRVNGKEYLLYNHKTFLRDFNTPDGEIEVITVIDGDKHFCEIVRISDRELVLSASNFNLNLIKISDEVSNDFKEQEKQKNQIRLI